MPHPPGLISEPLFYPAPVLCTPDTPNPEGRALTAGKPNPYHPVMLTIRKIGKHLGAEISGVDLSHSLDDNTFAQVANAFFDNEGHKATFDYDPLPRLLYRTTVRGPAIC